MVERTIGKVEKKKKKKDRDKGFKKLKTYFEQQALELSACLKVTDTPYLSVRLKIGQSVSQFAKFPFSYLNFLFTSLFSILFARVPALRIAFRNCTAVFE